MNRYKNTVAKTLSIFAMIMMVYGILYSIINATNMSSEIVEVDDMFTTKEKFSLDLYLAVQLILENVWKACILFGLAELIEALYSKKQGNEEKNKLDEVENKEDCN